MRDISIRLVFLFFSTVFMQNDKKTSRMSSQSISFYNEMAGNYNHMLEQVVDNGIVRQKVAQRFLDEVKSGRVLDFGGRTGLDLGWLSRGNYSILFCEPASDMRRQARHHNNDELHYDDIVFLDDTRADFSKWNTEPPFINRVDGILANFAVFNCIGDIHLLFKSLASVTKPGGHLIAIILNKSKPKNFKLNFLGTIRSLLSGSPLRYNVRFNQRQHTVYIHTTSALKKASAKYFKWHNPEIIDGSNFLLLHLIRK